MLYFCMFVLQRMTNDHEKRRYLSQKLRTRTCANNPRSLFGARIEIKPVLFEVAEFAS